MSASPSFLRGLALLYHLQWCFTTFILIIGYGMREVSAADLQTGEGEIDTKAEGGSAQPVPPVVFSATRIETPLAGVGSTVTVISQEELRERQITELQTALREIPGVDVIRNGGQGGNVSVFLRGANSEHTVVLIDGIELNDPITTARSVNFSSITLDEVDRIEVLRGPQSTLYGSDALGGVVNIVTRRGMGPASFSASGEAGSRDTYRGQFHTSGGNERYGYALGVTREDTNGISANGRAESEPENDSFGNTSAAARLDMTPHEQFTLTGFFRAFRSNADIDDGAGSGGDDPNRRFNIDRQLYRLEANGKFFEGVLRSTGGIAYANNSFEDNDDPDPENPEEVLRSTFDSSLLKLDLLNTVSPSDVFDILLGAEYEGERADSLYRSVSEFGPFESTLSDLSAHSHGFYAQLALNDLSGFSSTFGIRVDHLSTFGEKVTWRVTPTYLFDATGTRLRASVGTAFKAPSLYERFSDFGRDDLKPEESIGVDAGIEQPLFDQRIVLGGTYFDNTFDDLITFDPNTFQFENIAEAVTKGVELTGAFRLSHSISLDVNYTLLDAEDRSTGLALLRRAKNRLNATFRYTPVDRLTVALQVSFVGERVDNNFLSFPPERVTLGEFTVVNARARYTLSDNVEIFARIENILDDDYEEILGYNAPGTTAFGGIRYRIGKS